MTAVNSQFVESIAEIPQHIWDRCAAESSPFTSYAFLSSLERSGAVGEQSGWLPYHWIAKSDDNEIIAVAPCYIKLHSYGEYVFDWSWAEAYDDHNLDYYPKIINAVPFTPSAGKRLLCQHDDQLPTLTALFTKDIREACKALSLSSAHVLFPQQNQTEELVRHSMMKRTGVQFHWHNYGYRHFDDFLSGMKARKRKSIKKERKQREAQGINIRILEGTAATERDWQEFYRFYRTTYYKRSGHRGYLNQAFFLALGKAMPENLVLMFADRGNSSVAGALYIKSDSTLFGRYWGCSEHNEFLHFELCYYQGIDYCILHGLSHFDAGAQGEHKLMRGFEPVLTYSVHHIVHDGFRHAIADFLRRETPHILAYRDDAQRHLPYKEKDTTNNE